MASSDALRLKILRFAHSEYPRWVDRDYLLRLLRNVAADEVDREVFYLAEKSLVRLGKALGFPWTELQITATGIDVTEGKREL
jgi:hypothetical protein